MPNDLAQKLGDGDGPAVVAKNPHPGIIRTRPVVGNVRVSREGEVVALQIGNSVLRLKYRDAIQIGQWLMTKGVEAKFLAGDAKRILLERR